MSENGNEHGEAGSGAGTEVMSVPDDSADQSSPAASGSLREQPTSKSTMALKSSFRKVNGVVAKETSPKETGSKTTTADSLMMRLRPKVAKTSSLEKEESKSPKTDGRKLRFRLKGQNLTLKNDKRKRRHKAPRVKTLKNDPVFDEPPKLEGENNTSSTHDGRDEVFDSDDRSDSSSLDLSTSKGGGGSSDKDQECDSSSSSNSGSNTQKTDAGGLLEHAKGDKVINASRFIFFAILGTSAIVFAVVSYSFFKRNETEQFYKQFTAQAEEIQLYTQHNVDSVFDTLKGLAASTTSVVKRQVQETDWPAGFIQIPDVDANMGLARNLSRSLALAYMPKVKKGDYDKWIEYSMAHKDWIAQEQPDGPEDVEPIIRPFIWEYTDYYWEDFDDMLVYNLDITQEIPGKEQNQSTTDGGNPGLRGIGKRPLGSEPNNNGRRLEDTDDNYFGGGFGNDETIDDDNRFIPGTDMKDVSKDRSSSDDDYSPGVELEPHTIMQAPTEDEYQTPVWQISPIPTVNSSSPEVQVVNYNLADRVTFFKAVEYMENSRAPVLLDIDDMSSWFLIHEHRDVLQTVVAFPVMDDFGPNASIVGYFTAIIPWRQFFVNRLADKTNDIVVVMNNTCGEIFSVNVTSERGADIIGDSDEHDPKYDPIKQEYKFARDYNREDYVEFQEEICLYNITIYPTKAFEDSVRSNRPLIVSLVIVLVFVFTSFAFMMFDCLVTKRQNRLLNTAMRQNAIVNSLFPKNIQRKLMAEADDMIEAEDKNKNFKRKNLTTFLNDDQRGQERKPDHLDSKPIADLFPNTTIMFADISGFTAWSSAREPEAVFTLLETIYKAFDEIAKRRRVFKVEVVGDCYVAVCGLPDPRKDHYAVMCRFAQDCMAAMHVHTKELEVRLGPDTGDLSLRVGLHSGPVVAGVLRGDKSRFQLFGDTMNTASRMESTGVQNRIQVSQATADLLILNGKEHWITKRLDKVRAKGKGEMTTYFLLSVKKKSSSTTSASTSKIDEVVLVRSGKHSKGIKTVEKRNRVADWVVEMLGKLLKEMKAKRKLTGIRRDSKSIIQELETKSIGSGSTGDTEDRTVIDEVAEYLKLLSFYTGGSGRECPMVSLDKEVIDELQHYVYSVASLYKKNPFHNFEHASHVSMSCIKLLNRIASHDEENLDSSNHHTYGICSDPLTSFAIVFSALIHDVDHCGVPNAQLVKEQAEVATMYKNKSVAEQNSIDIGWGLLMEPTYSNLRRHIYTTAAEYKCFRQIVVNCIMATDICDRDLIQARNKRWDLAFSSDASSRYDGEQARQMSYRKATVVIEHLIQLSDVSHTMQHWHMYRRWNERLFEEGYKAYIEGRAEKDPSENWYKGELGFYDFYIIPLAKKIKQCAVFGVSSDEYLSYAVANRQEWEERGHEVVRDMVNKVHAIYNNGGNNSETKDSERPASPTLGSALSSHPNLKELDAQADTNDDGGAPSESVHAEEPTSRSCDSGYSEGYGNEDDEDGFEGEVGDLGDSRPTSESESSFNV